VSETGLATALNVSYMASTLSLFSLVGIALVLAGIGFIVLALAALPARPAPASSPAPSD
jgi:Na+/H+-translocating membrane pyrophosphatase